MRNTILVIVAVASITFAAPAFAVSQCSNNVCLDDKPISDLFDTSPSPGSSFYRTMNPSKCQPGTLGIRGITTAAARRVARLQEGRSLRRALFCSQTYGVYKG